MITCGLKKKHMGRISEKIAWELGLDIERFWFFYWDEIHGT